MNTPQNPQPPLHADGQGPRRKAFIFYSNWFTDARRSLTDSQLAEFLLVIIRYASENALPDDTTTPIVATMFALIRNAIDKDLTKYEEIAEENRLKAEKSAEKRRSAIKRITAENVVDDNLADPDVEVVDYEQSQCLQPILNTQYSELNTQDSTQKGKKGEEEARGEMLAPREEIEAYWRDHHYKSDVSEFLDYYTRRHWVTSRGIRLRSWKRAAVMWEDKYCRDVLPQRRREARVQATLEAHERTARLDSEAATQRRAHQATLEADQDRTQRRSVSAELGKYMYRRALLLTNGNDNVAMELMRQAPDNSTIFKRLAEGYTPTAQ